MTSSLSIISGTKPAESAKLYNQGQLVANAAHMPAREGDLLFRTPRRSIKVLIFDGNEPVVHCHTY
jgi:hypothetical protein